MMVELISPGDHINHMDDRGSDRNRSRSPRFSDRPSPSILFVFSFFLVCLLAPQRQIPCVRN